ncbi:hypothetical protein GC197_11715 [bacterium]|nr:hypothetical protein [bacterium]
MKRTQAISVFSLLLSAAFVSLALADDVEQSIKNLSSTDNSAKLAAIDHLGSLGDKAAPAVEPLAELLKDSSPEVVAHAAHALGQIGKTNDEALEELVELTGSDVPLIRRQAVSALFQLHPDRTRMQKIFVSLLADEDAAVRLRAMNSLTEIGKPAVNDLIPALKNDKAALWACMILRELGPDAAGAAGALTDIVKDIHSPIRQEAILTLAAMPEAAAASADTIAACLDDPKLQVPATYALGRIGTLPKEAEAKIQANVNSKEPMLASMSAWALAFAHPNDPSLKKEAIHHLAQGVGSSDPLVRAMSSQGLISLEAEPITLKQELQDPLNNADEPVVSSALNLLSRMGPEAIPFLIQALDKPGVRLDAIIILGDLGPKAAPATEAVAKMIDDENPRVVNEAIVTLGKIGPAAHAATPALIKALKEEEGSIAHNAALSLGRIGPQAKEAVPALLNEMTGHSQPSLQMISAWALLKIDGENAQTRDAVLSVLTAQVKSDDPIIQNSAKQLLGELNGAGK